jgi:C1A family cysteine protease
MSKFNLNWQPDLPDQRDIKYDPGLKKFGLSKRIDLRGICPPIYNQGSLGSCVYQTAAAQLQIVQVRTGYEEYMPSRLFMYYCARVRQNSVNRDSGSSIRMSMKVMASDGACDESMWKYNTKQYKTKPPANAFNAAKKHTIDEYQRVEQTPDDIRAALHGGFPVSFGFTVYKSFNSVGKNGIVPIPEKNEKVLGGHAVLIVGYEDAKQQFLVRNSWGEGWGENGYCYFSYGHILNKQLCSDFWVVQKI